MSDTLHQLDDAPPIHAASADESFGPEPFLADNGYPSDAECERIANWPVSDAVSFEDLFEYISDRWWPDGDNNWRDGQCRLATGGWSGNEDMISALQRNALAWSMTWQETYNGGLHVFQIPNWKGGEQ